MIATDIGQIWTTKQMGEKVVAEVAGAELYLTSDERLAWVVHFPLDKIMEVCEAAGTRRKRKGGKGRSAEEMALVREAQKRAKAL